MGKEQRWCAGCINYTGETNIVVFIKDYLNQLIRRVKKKKPGYGRSGSRGGVRFPTLEEEQLPTGRCL